MPSSGKTCFRGWSCSAKAISCVKEKENWDDLALLKSYKRDKLPWP